MPGKRISDLPAISGASTANDDNLVIFDTSEGTTKRILRSQLAAGIVGDLPYTPAGFIAATTVPTAIAEIASDLAASSGSSLVGFLQSGVGAATRTTQAKLRDVVSVKDFGAVGDGVVDDTAAIQAAITAATGKALYFPQAANFYSVADELVIPTGTSVIGDGWGSKIKQTGANKNLFVAGKFSFFSGLHLIGKGTGATDFTKNSGIYADLVGNFTITNCAIEQFEGSGIEVRRCHDFKIINNFLFANIWSSYSGGVPGASTADILLYSSTANSSRIQITGNHCLSNNSQGIYADALGGNGDIVIANNVCVALDASTCTEAGAWTEFAMTTNASALQRRHGIIISYTNQSQSGPRCVVSNNVCRNTGWTGIYKEGVSQGPVIISNNICTNNGYGTSNALSGGIWVYADGNELVNGNYIDGFKNTDTLGSGGITIAATVIPTQRTVISNNIVKNSANHGVFIGTNSALIDVIGNTIINNTRDAIFWSPNSGQTDVGALRVENNTIYKPSSTVRPAVNFAFQSSTKVSYIRNNVIIGADNTTANQNNTGIYVTGANSNLARVTGNQIDTFYYGYYNATVQTGRSFNTVVERNIVENCNTAFVVKANNNDVTVPLVGNRLVNVTTPTGADGFYVAGRICEKVGERLYWETTAAPAVGSWAIGDRSVNTTPAVGQPKAWACTVAGTPGTWVSEGNL